MPSDLALPASLSSSRCWPLTYWCLHLCVTLTFPSMWHMTASSLWHVTFSALFAGSFSAFRAHPKSSLPLGAGEASADWRTNKCSFLPCHMAAHPSHPTVPAYSLEHMICPRNVAWYFCLRVRVIDLDCTQWWFKSMFIRETSQRTVVSHLLWLERRLYFLLRLRGWYSITRSERVPKGLAGAPPFPFSISALFVCLCSCFPSRALVFLLIFLLLPSFLLLCFLSKSPLFPLLVVSLNQALARATPQWRLLYGISSLVFAQTVEEAGLTKPVPRRLHEQNQTAIFVSTSWGVFCVSTWSVGLWIVEFWIWGQASLSRSVPRIMLRVLISCDEGRVKIVAICSMCLASVLEASISLSAVSKKPHWLFNNVEMVAHKAL